MGRNEMRAQDQVGQASLRIPPGLQLDSEPRSEVTEHRPDETQNMAPKTAMEDELTPEQRFCVKACKYRWYGTNLKNARPLQMVETERGLFEYAVELKYEKAKKSAWTEAATSSQASSRIRLEQELEKTSSPWSLL